MRRYVGALFREARGVSVLESVVALLLGVLLMALVLALLARQRDVVGALAGRAEALATVRTFRSLLRREARAVGVGAWRVFPDSVALRAFRGAATVCPEERDTPVIRVSWWGVRAPDPSKDSVMVVLGPGAALYRALVRTEGAGAGCGAGDAQPLERWTLSEAVPPGSILVRYFEHGSYHLSGEAFRYRRGAAGRQPLTPAALLTPESRFLADGDILRALLVLNRSAADPVDVFVARRHP